jgi:hypothetical protein
VLRLTARQQILIGELTADHVMPTISRRSRSRLVPSPLNSKQGGDL